MTILLWLSTIHSQCSLRLLTNADVFLGVARKGGPGAYMTLRRLGSWGGFFPPQSCSGSDFDI